MNKLFYDGEPRSFMVGRTIRYLYVCEIKKSIAGILIHISLSAWYGLISSGDRACLISLNCASIPNSWR